MNFILDNASRTILVVDDEPAITTILDVVLSRAGYRVISSTRPVEALAYSDDPRVQVDLLLTDVVMPVLDGTRFAALFRHNSPRTKVLFMTGHAARLPADADFIAKPFHPRQVVARVHAALGFAACASA